MTESQLRQAVVDIMRGWLGWSEANGKYKAIIDLYNTQRPLPVGYAVKYSDDWCAATVSAAGLQAGLEDIIYPECSCYRMVQLYQAAGRWMEDDSYVPEPGDLIMYDWQDTGVGDDTGVPDHVGIVAEVNGNTMTLIEGNRSNQVKTVTLAVNARNIRGYCLPDYASKATEEETMTYQQFKEFMSQYEAEKAAAGSSDWAKTEKVVERVTAAGISDGTRPQSNITREECMAMILRATDK